MAIRVIVDLNCTESGLTALVEMFQSALHDTAAFDGCSGLEMIVNQDANQMLLYETWDSRPQYDKYFAWRVENGLIEALGPHLAAEPKVSYYNVAGTF